MFFKKLFFLTLFPVCISAEQDDARDDQEKVSYIVDVTKETFESEVLQADQLVIVDGYAPWCAPCQHMRPIFDELATQFNGKIKFVSIDVQADFPFSLELKIELLPTFIFFKDGKEVDRMIGVMAPEDFAQKLEAML